MRISLFVAMILIASSARAVDFYLAPQECKSLIGSLSNAKLSVVNSDLPTFACSRSGKKVNCTLLYESGGNPTSGRNTESYEILWDSPPALYFASSDNDNARGTFFSVNTQTRAAVMTSRASDSAYAGQKVCTFVFATQSELEALKRVEKNRTK